MMQTRHWSNFSNCQNFMQIQYFMPSVRFTLCCAVLYCTVLYHERETQRMQRRHRKPCDNWAQDCKSLSASTHPRVAEKFFMKISLRGHGSLGISIQRQSSWISCISRQWLLKRSVCIEMQWITFITRPRFLPTIALGIEWIMWVVVKFEGLIVRILATWPRRWSIDHPWVVQNGYLIRAEYLPSLLLFVVRCPNATRCLRHEFCTSDIENEVEVWRKKKDFLLDRIESPSLTLAAVMLP